MINDISLVKDKIYSKNISESEWFYILELLPSIPASLRKQAITYFLKSDKDMTSRASVLFQSPNIKVREMGLKIAENLPFEISAEYIKKAIDDYSPDLKNKAFNALETIITREFIDARAVGSTDIALTTIYNKFLRLFSLDEITFHEPLLAIFIKFTLKRRNLRQNLVNFLTKAFIEKCIDETFMDNTLKRLDNNERILLTKLILSNKLVFCYGCVKRYLTSLRYNRSIETIFLSIADDKDEIYILIRERLKRDVRDYIESLKKETNEQEVAKYISILSRIGNRSAFDAVVAYKDTPVKEIRISLINGMKFFRKFNSAGILADILNTTKDADIELAAMNSLAETDFEVFQANVARLLMSDNELIKAVVLSLIEKYSGHRNIGFLKLLYPRITKGNIIKMFQAYPSFLDKILDEAYSSDANIRKIVLEILREVNINDKHKVFNQIKDMVYDNDEYIRSMCISILSYLDVPEANELLLNRLNDPDLRVQANVIEGISGAQGMQVLSAPKFLHSSDNRIRANAAVFLLKSGGASGEIGLDVLNNMMNDNNYLMRASGAWGLGEVGGIQEMEYIQKLREKEDKDIVLRNIDKAVEKIKRRDVQNK